MLSLLSDEYRGKIQGLRIGAASCDITDAKVGTLSSAGAELEIKSDLKVSEPNQLIVDTIRVGETTNQLAVKDNNQNTVVLLNPANNSINFTGAVECQGGLYTNSLYPLTGGGTIQSLAAAINRFNTFQYYEYRNQQNFTITGTTYGSGLNFPASLTPPTFTSSNFNIAWATSLDGWVPPIAFTQDSVYQITFSTLTDNSNHPVNVELSGVVSQSTASMLTRCTIPSGNGVYATFSGTWRWTPTETLALRFYSPQGITTLNNFNFHLTINRIN